jgi:hypothetical protein
VWALLWEETTPTPAQYHHRIDQELFGQEEEKRSRSRTETIK